MFYNFQCTDLTSNWLKLFLSILWFLMALQMDNFLDFFQTTFLSLWLSYLAP